MLPSVIKWDIEKLNNHLQKLQNDVLEMESYKSTIESIQVINSQGISVTKLNTLNEEILKNITDRIEIMKALLEYLKCKSEGAQQFDTVAFC